MILCKSFCKNYLLKLIINHNILKTLHLQQISYYYVLLYYDYKFKIMENKFSILTVYVICCSFFQMSKQTNISTDQIQCWLPRRKKKAVRLFLIWNINWRNVYWSSVTDDIVQYNIDHESYIMFNYILFYKSQFCNNIGGGINSQ